MRQYKIIAHVLLILPIINLAFAAPISGQETRQVCDDVVPDVTITMSAKRGDETKVQPEASDHGSMDPPQMGTSEIQQPGLSKSPSLDHYLESPGSDASLKHYLESPESYASFASADDRTAPSGSVLSTMKSFLRKVVGKLKFWRRISGPVSVRDAVNAVQRESQGLVDTGATMVRDIGKSSKVSEKPATRGVRRPAASKPS